MDVDTEKAKTATDRLSTAVSDFANTLIRARAVVPTEELLPAYRAVESKLAALGETIGTARKTVGLSAFFSSVGDSIVNAQRMLDNRSEAYLKQTATSPHIQPTVFRIPSVSAEVKFALETMEGKETNLVFFSESQTAQTQHQQSLQFEIAAVPPPPEVVEKLRLLAPHVELILSPGTRSVVFQAVGEAEATAATSKDALITDQNRVLVCRAGCEGEFFLLYASPSASKLLGLWHLKVDPPTLQPVYKYQRSPADGEVTKPLKDFVEALADRQAELLKEAT